MAFIKGIECDHCGKRIEFPAHTTQAKMTSSVRKHELWTVGKRILCWQCQYAITRLRRQERNEKRRLLDEKRYL